MKDTLLLWLPRTAGAATALFVSLFALDAFANSDWRSAIPDFLAHLTPAVALALVVFVAWRRPLVGAIAFLALAVAYAATTQRGDWILAVSGPLGLAGALYFASWLRFRTIGAP